MICPKCRAEYRRGFTECADCGVALVEPHEMLEGDAANGERAAALGDPNEDPFCSFWKGTDLRVCTEICTVLDEAGIAHKMIRRQDHLFNFSNQSPYQVGVPASLYEKAELAIKEAFGTEEETGEDAVRLLLPPDSSEPDDPESCVHSVWSGDSSSDCASYGQRLKEAGIAYRVVQNHAKYEKGLHNYYEIRVQVESYYEAEKVIEKEMEELSNEAEEPAVIELPLVGNGESTAGPGRDAAEWYPEDATSLAWEGEPAEAREMIELSMRENDIRLRWEMKDGEPKLYVLPEDEERAKEIVREILEGEPPE